MPSWKKVIVSGSNAVLSSVTASFQGNLTGTASFALTAPYSGLTGTVPTWNQNTTGNAATATTASFATSSSNARSAITASSSDDFFVRGNVGIGTAPSGNRLEVQGGGRFNNALQLFGGSSGNSPRLILGGETSSTDKSIFLESFFMVFQGHNNEGFKFNTTTSAGVVSTRMVILGSGNVGIGTGTPFGTATNRTVLSVNGTTDVSLNIGSGGTQRAYLYGANSYAEIGTIGSLPLIFAPNNSEKMRLTSVGNLGIGTSLPTAVLHTVAVTTGDDTVAVIEGTGVLGSGLHLKASGTSGRTWRLISTGTSSTPGAGTLGFYDSTAALYRVVINTTGNLGVSSTAPNRLFSVRSQNNEITPMAGFYALNETQGVEIWYGGIIMSGSNTNVSLSLSPKGNGSTNIPIGNLGVGTTSPTNKLQVVGGVTATSFTGSLFGTASFAITASHAHRAKLADSASFVLVTYESQPPQASQYWLTVADTFGTKHTSLLSDSRLSYFTDNGTLFSPVFSGSFIGTITNATSASFAPNFANTNLTFNNNRTHNLNGNNLTFTATEDESIIFNLTSGGSFEIKGSPTIQTSGVIQHSGSGTFTGNIGIGTVAPIAKLHVSGSSGSLAFNVEGSQGQLFSVTDSLSGSLMSVNDISGLPILEVFSDDRVLAGKFGSIALSVSGSNVGIGAYNPARKLDVYHATAQIVAQFSSSNASSTRIKFSDANTGTENVNIGAVGTRLALFTNNIERFSVLSGGNVGIGTTAPGNLLSVLGTVSASAFIGLVTNATSASFSTSASYANNAGNAATANFATTATSSSFASTAPYSGLTGTVPTWNQNTTGNAASATVLQTARTIGGVSFNGSANINLPGVNIAGNQNTTGNAATATSATSASFVRVTYESQPVQGAQYWLTVADTFGTKHTSLLSDSRLSYFTDTGTLFSPVFSGSFTGTITNATSASFAPNFANQNLTFNSNRTHDLDGNNLTFTATEDESIIFNHTSGGSFEIKGSPTIQTTGEIQHIGSGYFTGNIGIGTTATTTARLHVSASTGNIIRATAAGSDILIISSSGNVGIGTSNPTTKLSISDGVAMYANQTGALLDIKINATNGNDTTSRSGLRLGNKSNAFSIFYGGTSDRLRFIDGGGIEVMSLINGGNVGIGTVAPTRRLQIGNFSSTSTATPETFSLGATFSNLAGSNPKIRVWEDGTYSMGFGVSSDQLDYILGRTLYKHVFYAEGNHLMTILGTGNVGIGTTNPAAKFLVSYQGGNGSAGDSNYSILAKATGQQTIGAIATNDGYSNLNLGSTVAGNLRMWHISKRISTNSADLGGGDGITMYYYSGTFVQRFGFTTAGNFVASGSITAKTLANTNQANAVMYNSGTGLLTYVSTGSIGVGTATNADNIFVSENATNAAQPVLFASNTEGYHRARGDKNDFNYNPATNTLTVVTLNAQEKSFSIPHQGLPGKKLVYGVVEGPEHSVYVRGKSTDRVINLPEEWEWLVDKDSITVSLTPIGEYYAIYVEEIADNKIYLNSNVDTFKYFYHIYATRKDVKPLKTIQ